MADDDLVELAQEPQGLPAPGGDVEGEGEPPLAEGEQGMIVAATSFALQWALRQAVQKLQDAKTERQKEAARKEVDEALAALRKARRDAGLPDK